MLSSRNKVVQPLQSFLVCELFFRRLILLLFFFICFLKNWDKCFNSFVALSFFLFLFLFLFLECRFIRYIERLCSSKDRREAISNFLVWLFWNDLSFFLEGWRLFFLLWKLLIFLFVNSLVLLYHCGLIFILFLFRFFAVDFVYFIVRFIKFFVTIKVNPLFRVALRISQSGSYCFVVSRFPN